MCAKLKGNEGVDGNAVDELSRAFELAEVSYPGVSDVLTSQIISKLKR